jgi:DNA polymerase I-like protein with 3'-5' exonuclease and polymerase domains
VPLDLDFVRTKLPEHILEPDPEIYRSPNYVALDYETTIIGKGLAVYDENSIVLSVWSLGPGHPFYVEGERNRYYSWENEYGLGMLVAAIEAADFLIAHNAKFELQWLDRCGLNLTEVVVWDTMLAEYVLGGNRWTWGLLSLNNCAKRHFGEAEGKVDVVSALIKGGVCCTEIPRSWLLKYCVQDTSLTERLYHAQLAAMENTRLLPVVYTRCLATPVLADLEKHGMYLDGEKVAALRKQKEAEYAEVMRELDDVTGGINVNSPLQLRSFLYETLGFEERKGRNGEPIRTDSGLAKTDADTIKRLRATSVAQRSFLELYTRSKELYNELTKYLRKFDECCAETGGHLRAQFNQSNTRTHRLSSSGLDYNTQFQNFPRMYKPLFRSRHEGWYVGEADGSQLEFRVAAHLGRDHVAVDDIVAGADIHTVTASVIWPGETPDNDSVPHPRRTEAKAHTFKPLYGGRSGTPEQVRYYEFFREKYAGIAETQHGWINTVLDTGELETEWGLRYYWPDTKMQRSGYVTNSTSICNYPVQAFATAEIIPIGLVYAWHYVKRTDLRMLLVNTVHDSIIAELPPEEVEDFDALSYRCMVEETYRYVERVYGIRLIVPLAAGVAHGEHWSDGMAKKNERQYTAEDKLWRQG